MPESLFLSVCVCASLRPCNICSVLGQEANNPEDMFVYVCEVKYGTLWLGRVVIHPYIGPLVFSARWSLCLFYILLLPEHCEFCVMMFHIWHHEVIMDKTPIMCLANLSKTIQGWASFCNSILYYIRFHYRKPNLVWVVAWLVRCPALCPIHAGRGCRRRGRTIILMKLKPCMLLTLDQLRVRKWRQPYGSQGGYSIAKRRNQRNIITSYKWRCLISLNMLWKKESPVEHLSNPPLQWWK